jgi:hypothetical protein
MQAAASILTDSFSALLGRLPSGLDLDRLAFETGAILRGRDIKHGAELLRMALARGPGGLSLRETAAWASMIGLAEISNPGVKYRLNQSVDFQHALIQHLLADKLDGPVPLWPGRIIRMADGTCISKPASTGTDWRVHAVFDLGRAGFAHLEVTDKHGAESLCRGTPVAGEIRIGDRYFARAPSLHKFRTDSAGEADFIVRLRWNGLRLSKPDASRFDLIQHLLSLPATPGPHEVNVLAEVGRFVPPLKLRLILLRKSPAASEATRADLKRQASRKQKQIDPRSLLAAEFTMLATSLPPQGYPAEQVLTAYRLRWQIELAFKRLKSLLHIDKLPTRTERGSRSWLYAHLIMALISDDISQQVLESSP